MSKKGEKPAVFIYDRESEKYFKKTIIIDPEGRQKLSYLTIDNDDSLSIPTGDIGKIPQYIIGMEFLENSASEDIPVIGRVSE
jgi:hypothetical protein